MRKRILSLALVFVLVFSLVPFSAFAASTKTSTTILSQPKDVTVNAGDDAVFTISAVNSGSLSLRYLWYDVNSSAIDSTKLTALKAASTYLYSDLDNIFGSAKLGEGRTLTLTRVQENMQVCCIVYCIKQVVSVNVAADIVFSNEVSLTVTPLCAEHVYGENLKKVDSLEATCAHEGNIEYYKCTECGRCYADEDATTQVTSSYYTIAKLTTHSMPLTHVDAVAGTCDSKSIAEYWVCPECGQLFKDADGTQTTTLAKLKSEGSKDADNHVNVIHYDAKAATCCDKGNIEYWYCDDCNTYFQDEALTKECDDDDVEIAKNASNHTNLVEHKHNDATCTEEGNLAYWECTGCNKYYKDAAGTQEYSSKSDVTIDELGHNYVWIEYEENGVMYHAQECTRCFTLKNVGTHSGGTATCTEQAVCSTCGMSYGELDPSNHTHTEIRNAKEATIWKTGYSGDTWCTDCNTMIAEGTETEKLCRHTSDSSVVIHHEAVEATCTECEDHHTGNTEYWECKVCGKLYSDEALTTETTLEEVTIAEKSHYIEFLSAEITNSEVSVSKYDDLGHWTECKYCGYVYADTYSTHTMVSTTATCCNGTKHCLVCGYDSGDYDKTNHTGGTEVRNAYEPDGKKAGYTGDTYCLGCGELISTGRYYYNPCDGGCKDTLVYVAQVDKTCYVDGVKAHYVCTECLNMYSDANATVAVTEDDLVIEHGHNIHPSIEALTAESGVSLIKILRESGAKIDLSAILSGDTSSFTNLTIDDVLANIHISDIDHCYDDECHWLGCQDCGKTLKDLEPELTEQGIIISQQWYEIGAKETHSGGTATCQKRAVCEECGEEYGELAAHRYGEDNVCTVCGDVLPSCAAPEITVSCNAQSGKIVISWDEVEDAASYQVWRSTASDGKYTNIGSVTDTSFTDYSAPAGTKYYYKVRAIGTNGSYGEYSAISKGIVCDCARPSVVAVNSASSGRIVVKWAAVDGAESYAIYRSTSKSNFTDTALKTVTGTSFTDTTAKVGKTYYYKVVAIGSTSSANSAPSNVVNAMTKLAKPTVKATNVASTGKIKLTWDEVSGATKYYVYRSTDGESFKYLTSTTKTSITNTSANAGTLYYYYVVAVYGSNTDANSKPSATVKRTCDCARPTVTIKLSNGDPKLSWSAVTGADKYVIYRATSKSGTYSKLATTSKLYCVNTSAKSGKTYYYKVMAVCSSNSAANSAYSSVVSITAK